MNHLPNSATPTPKKIVICISGMAGTGKSTLAKKLAKKYGLQYFSGGDALRLLAKEKGYNVASNGWWETREGLNFIRERKKDYAFDKLVDKKLLDYAKQGNVLLDSWTMPWLVENGFKIWLTASVQKQAERIAQRDKITVDEAVKALKEKESRTKAIFKELYGFDLGEDFSPFNFILDTDNLNAEEVFYVLCLIMEKIILGKNSNNNILSK